MPGTRSVADLLNPVNVHVVVVLVVVVVLGVGGTVSSGRTVTRLTEEIAPIASSNATVQRDMLVLRSGTHAWVQSGQKAVLEPYRVGEARLAASLQRLKNYAEPGSELDALVTQQAAAIDSYRDYSRSRIARPGGLDTYDQLEFLDGERRFDEFAQAHTATTAAFEQQFDAAQNSARVVLWSTLAAMAVVGLLGLAFLRRTRRHLLEALELPLQNLELVAQQLTQHVTAARAELTGPREVQAVARALNGLAAAHESALAVEEQLRSDQSALDSAKEDFVSNVSHELRTPLTVLNGYLEMVRDEFEDRLSPRHQRMMDASERNVARLGALIEDLLTLSRSETHEPVREVVDGRKVVAEVVDDVRVTAAQRGVRITMDNRLDSVAWVLGDQSQLFRALLNLVGNAVKFSHSGGLVDVGLERRDEWLTIWIRDRGLGIPGDELERLGSRFFRGSNAISQEVGGTGLGLRITQSIIDSHAGDLHIASEESVGTTVTVRLQILPTTSDAGAPHSGAPQGAQVQDQLVPAGSRLNS